LRPEGAGRAAHRRSPTALTRAGFDRPAFHAQLYGEVATFLRAAPG
jgi:hypothetical protein